MPVVRLSDVSFPTCLAHDLTTCLVSLRSSGPEEKRIVGSPVPVNVSMHGESRTCLKVRGTIESVTTPGLGYDS